MIKYRYVYDLAKSQLNICSPCAEMQSPSKFATQVTGADVNSKYSVQIGDLSCPIVGQKGQLSPGDDMSSCDRGFKKYLGT